MSVICKTQLGGYHIDLRNRVRKPIVGKRIREHGLISTGLNSLSVVHELPKLPKGGG